MTEDPYTAGYRDAIHKATRTLEEMAERLDNGYALNTSPAEMLRSAARGIREGSVRPPARVT